MKAVEPEKAEGIKRPIDAASPFWRQVQSSRDAETPPIIVVEVEGKKCIVVAASVFGAGHLDTANWWQDRGDGAVIMANTAAIEETGETKVRGFIHFHRTFTQGRSALMTIQAGSPAAEAVAFFVERQCEYSAFIEVVFARNGTVGRPWRAIPPSSDT